MKRRTMYLIYECLNAIAQPVLRSAVAHEYMQLQTSLDELWQHIEGEY